VWSEQPLQPGERIAVTGFSRPTGARPGLVDPADAVRARGAELELSAKTVTRLDDDPTAGSQIWRWAHAQQRAWAVTIDHAGGDPVGSTALRGIVVGDRRDVPPELDDRWRAAGIYHVLSVSGHLAVVAGCSTRCSGA
jgi:predicted membrane metal-binding protein